MKLYEVITNRIKAKLAAEIDKARHTETPRHQVPGFQQRGHHLTLAATKQGWAIEWRTRALEVLPDTVASVVKAEAVTRRGHAFRMLVFRDADETPLVAVMPSNPNSIHRFIDLRGTTLSAELGSSFSITFRDQ